MLWQDYLDPNYIDHLLAIKRKLLTADEVPLTDDNYGEVYDQWFGAAENTKAPGFILGVHEVHRRLEEGAAFAEVMAWSPEQILDLKATA
jgi:hypothetical protein